MKKIKLENVSFLFLIFAFYLQSTLVQGANIMFFIGLSSYSHQDGMWPLAVKLAERGHSVTFVSPYYSKTPNPNVTQVVPESLRKFIADSWAYSEDIYSQRVNQRQEDQWYKLGPLGVRMCETILSDPIFVGWVERSHFDLLIMDALISECGYGMAYKWKAKSILYSTQAVYPWYTDSFGIPDESSWIPDMVFHYPLEMNFFYRMKTALLQLYLQYWRASYHSEMEVIIRDKLNIPDMPTLAKFERDNVSLLFANQHFYDDFPRPLPPTVITLGGLQIVENPGPLPKEIETFLNSSHYDGFVYISFGSYAEFSTFPQDRRDVFVNITKKFPELQFVWKLNVDIKLPENVLTAKWMPQQSILAHPKLKAFVSHAGILGVQESTYYGVPLIAVPIFGEQEYNANKIHAREIGRKVEITTVTEEQLETAIRDVVENKKYSQNMKRHSSVFRDRPEKVLDKAVWWTEYVLRQPDIQLLKPLGIHQPWWKQRQLDVWALIFSLILIVAGILIKMLLVFGSYAMTVVPKSSNIKLKRM